MQTAFGTTLKSYQVGKTKFRGRTGTISIPKNAPAPNAGKLFVEFLLDREAAEIQIKDRSQVVMKGIKPLPGAKAMDEIKTMRPTEDEISKGIPEVKEKFRDLFGV